MNIIKACIVFTAVCVLTWLAVGFVAWELNPGKWEPVGRYVFVLIATALGGVAVAAGRGMT